MKEQKIVFKCNHAINILKRQVTLFNLKRGDGDTDQITNVGSISKIFYVSEDSNDGIVNYVYGVDYVLNNSKVLWLTENRPTRGKYYTCEALHNSRYIKDYSNNPENCERCNGMGWYLSPLSTAYKRFESALDLPKLVQDYIKIVYTRYDEEQDYGCYIVDYVGMAVSDIEGFISDVTAELQYAANRLKAIQQNAINSGAQYTDEELLDYIVINTTDFDRDKNALYINMTLVSAAGGNATLAFEV